MAFFAQIPTLVYTTVLGPDSAPTADLARLAFGALLWIVLVLLNRDGARASPPALGPRSRARAEPASPSRAPGAGTRRSSRSHGAFAPAPSARTSRILPA